VAAGGRGNGANAMGVRGPLPDVPEDGLVRSPGNLDQQQDRALLRISRSLQLKILIDMRTRYVPEQNYSSFAHSPLVHLPIRNRKNQRDNSFKNRKVRKGNEVVVV
jgi:hypothetical protein